ncbi:MAG TPA: T9SS type A sorting domain-containing protein, partial [Saprospiraceae bacterium]|nr:T9SS type A sorting domain-containing protein [Saprospiraceae bacterium]
DPATAIANYKDIMGWPGRGNPYFAGIWGFDLPFTQNGYASFHDEMNDGLYDPLQGDYPVVEATFTEFVPAEIVWCVFNDQGGGAAHGISGGVPTQIEVQLTVWAFNCSDQPVLKNTIFTEHRIINRGAESLDSCFIGLWVDFDIGCNLDDYIGSAPDLDAFYAYNNGVVDGSGNCPNSFSGPPPVQSVTFLSQSLDKFVYYNEPGFGTPLAATRAPDLPLEYYRYLTGRWRDGSPFTFGGSGYQSGAIETNHAFPDPPNLNGWSMCNENLPFSVQRTLGTTKVEDLGVGHMRRLVTAWTVHPNADLPCNLGDTFDDIAFLHNTFDDDFAGVCSGLTATHELADAQINIFPNPANESITLNYGDLPVREIRLIAPDGEIIQTYQNIQPEQTVLNVKGLNSGIYYLQIQSEQGSATKLVVIL